MKVQYFSEFFTYFFKVLSINVSGFTLRKISVRANVPDERNAITVICLSCWEVDCASPDKWKLEWKLHFLEWKSHPLELKNYNIRASISAFYHHFLALVGFKNRCNYLILSRFLPPVWRDGTANNPSKFLPQELVRKEINGWKIKKATGRYLVQIHPIMFWQ